MESKGREISVSERKIIIKLWKDGKSFRKIGHIIGRTYSSVQRVINNFKKTGILTSKPRSGRPKILSAREERTVVNMVKVNPRITSSKIVENVNQAFKKCICAETARKILRKAGYRGRVARRKPFISLVNRRKRIEFAHNYISKPPEFWKQVIFSDESKFCIFGIKGRQMVWRKPGTALDKQNLVGTVKHGGGGVMVWGCMAASGVGQLQFIESTMDKWGYLNILKHNLKQSAEQLNLSTTFWFQQDNDPKHTSEVVRLWLLYNAPRQLKTPPQSPDLNPIEHLWDLLEKRIRQHTITSKEILRNVMQAEWAKITVEDTEKLVNSMPNRLSEVLKHRGYPTKY